MHVYIYIHTLPLCICISISKVFYQNASPGSSYRPGKAGLLHHEGDLHDALAGLEDGPGLLEPLSKSQFLWSSIFICVYMYVWYPPPMRLHFLVLASN